MIGQRIGYIRVSTLDQNPERQREGIALAKQRDVYRGRKKSLTAKQAAEVQRRVTNGETKTKIAQDFGITRETLYQYLRNNTP
jgi:DNA invertase Pin-like site-specific DNA recombinase